MKKTISFIFILFFACRVTAQTTAVNIAVPDTAKKIMVVEAACGQCRFGLPGKSCDLAVRINGTAYFVSNTSIDEHGDAHAKDGFCNSIRKAEVQGEIVNNRFAVSYFKLITPAKHKGN